MTGQCPPRPEPEIAGSRIAELAGVDDHTVAAMRKRMTDTGADSPQLDQSYRRAVDGEVVAVQVIGDLVGLHDFAVVGARLWL
ncbi:MAG: hypothetical protein ACLQU2_07245 [Candidatus Binataceae bacterium]